MLIAKCTEFFAGNQLIWQAYMEKCNYEGMVRTLLLLQTLCELCLSSPEEMCGSWLDSGRGASPSESILGIHLEHARSLAVFQFRSQRALAYSCNHVP